VLLGLLLGCSVPPRENARSAPAAAAPADRDPQSAYEPRSAPGDGQQYLARMAGDWQVVKTFHRRGGEPAVTRGTCRQTMVQDGRFLQSEFVFEGEAGRSTGTGVIGFDPATGRFTSFWIDSRSTRVSIRQSEAGFDGREIVLWSRTLGDEPNARRSRTVSVVDADGLHMLHRQFAVSADGK